MDQTMLHHLLSEVKNGSCTIEDATQQLRRLPLETTPDACLDHHRTLRTGIPEVIYGESKTAEQIITIGAALLARSAPVLATRVDHDKAMQVQQALPELRYHPRARMLTCNEQPIVPDNCRGTVVVICAGTSDIPVAEEALLTAHCLGNPTEKLFDAGVAGLHRLLNNQPLLQSASVIIVAAGMEGALPSVVGGLVGCPVIGLPTSVGYGTSFGGLAALLGMLNSCAPGLGVVNIDNGFGAGCLASSINTM